MSTPADPNGRVANEPTSNFQFVAWNAALTPHFSHQRAWTRVPTAPLSSTSRHSTIMARVSSLTQRAQSTAASNPALPIFPGFFKFFLDQHAPPEDPDASYKVARTENYSPPSGFQHINSRKPSEAQIAHDICKALTDVANCHIQRAEERLFPLYRSLRDGSYQAPKLGKRRHGMDHSDLDIQKGTFRTICAVMPVVEMALRDKKEVIDVTDTAIAYQAWEQYPQNSRIPLTLHGIPELSDVNECSEESSIVRGAAPEPATISLDMHSDSDIFATAPMAQSPSSISTSSAAPAAISQLAEIAGNRLDGNAKVAIEEGFDGRLFVRFKISAAYASLFPRCKALDESSMVIGTPLFASTPKVVPYAEPETPTRNVARAPADEPLPSIEHNDVAEDVQLVVGAVAPSISESATTSEHALVPEVGGQLVDGAVAPSITETASSHEHVPVPQPIVQPATFEVATPVTCATNTDSTISELDSTPIIYQDEESPSREYMRGFIQRSKRVVNNTTPVRPALASRSPNQGSPEKQVSPAKTPSMTPAKSPKKSPRDCPMKHSMESPTKSPTKDSGAPTRRSSRLTSKAPKSAIPTPIRIDSRSGAGRVKAAAPDVTHVTRTNTRKNKGKAQLPAAVLLALTEAGEAAPVVATTTTQKVGKTVHWKSPVEEEPPKRVTRSRAKKIAAARA